jgi:glutaminyl-tRNA synthetase
MTAEEAKNKIPTDEERSVSPNFITDVIDEDLETHRHQRVATRFPPEPNGYLHIGHAKAICLNFGIAQDYRGTTNLRFDDTNPTTEDMRFVEAMKEDIRWLGFEWDNLFFASDYFEELYAMALRLIESGEAYVDSLSEEEIRSYRGTVTEPGRESPYRNRAVAENLDLFERMRAGEFPAGAHVLRAKIDMAARNMVMRDPVLYRIVHAHHYRTGDAWHIYPLYDFAHPLSDALEGITHSLCSLEFENNREIYDWLVDRLFEDPKPHQYEFARLNLDYTVVSKRKLINLVNEGQVTGWDDPRMPTLAGLRRRGVTPEAIRDFANRVGVTKANSRTDIALLEHSIRDDLNFKAPRVMAVVDPLKVVLTNLPADAPAKIEASYWPPDVPREGSRSVPFGRELYIERSDFTEDPPKGFRRLSPGQEVRLRYAYVIRCNEVLKDTSGHVTELRCSVDPATLGKNPEGRKVKGTIHWVSADRGVAAEFRLYDRLFRSPDPEAGGESFTTQLNPDSLIVKRGYVEPSVAADPPETRYQFERQGYFVRDSLDSRPEALVFNRIVTLRDSWTKRSNDNVAAREIKAEPKAPSREASQETDPVAALPPERTAVFDRYLNELGLSRNEAALIAGDAELSTFFEEALKAHDNPQGVANWIVNELLRARKGKALSELPVKAAQLAELVALIDRGVISSRIAKDVFGVMLESGRSPKEIVEEQGLEQLSDTSALTEIVNNVLAAHPDQVAAYRGGKSGLLGFFVGQVMRQTQGRANPQLVRELVGGALKGNEG